MNKKMKLFSKILIVALVLSMVLGSVASADTLPYITYNYDYWEDIVYTPAAYIPSNSINGQTLGLGHDFGSLYDLYTDDDTGLIFLVDFSYNAIYVLNSSYKLVTVIDEFYNTETGKMDHFKSPQGVFMSNSKFLYVCDTENQRLLRFAYDEETNEFTFESKLVSEMLETDILGENYSFHPMKVVVDSAERIYVINQNEFQGILQLEMDGTFNGYFGTITVSISLWQKFWRTISTKEQVSKSTMYIPTEYTGIDIDDDGFLYASYIDTNGLQAVMRLNSKGGDVIRKGANQNVGGDIKVGAMGDNLYCGNSRIKDVVYCGEGMYSMLDSLRGRIFTYDAEGNLLYIYGGIGTTEGTFSSPSGIEKAGSRILVTDVNRNYVSVFKPTQYGSLINEAVACRYDGDESQAVEKWAEVLVLNENFEQAYIGIGKAYLNDGQYKKAMDNLDLGMSKSYYSIAYKRYRNNILKQNFNMIFGSILVLFVAFLTWRFVKKRKNRKED